MAIGRTFPESLQKALRSLEHGPPRPQLRPGRGAARRARRRRAGAPRPRSPRPTARSSSRPRCAAASRSSGSHEATGSTRGSSTRSSLIVEERAAPRRASGFAAMTARATGGGPSGSASPTRQLALPLGRRPRPTCAPPALGRRRARHLQDRRHLRGRVRGRHAVPLLDLRGRGRGARRATGRKVVILGSGPEPHRPGHRVRLLLRARQLRPARRRLRDDHGQLQPRDRLDRLRHQRPPLLRAAHRTKTCSTSSRPSRRRASCAA